ncbi:L,D-transpeptidase family protein [Chitinophagales bacterium]|nr:L,D-transpeptidase family protein [Chitinophagales bacterium]
MRCAWIVSFLCSIGSLLSVQAQVSIRSKIQADFTDSISRFELQQSFDFAVMDSIYRINDYNPIFHRGLRTAYFAYLQECSLLGFELADYNYKDLVALHNERSIEANVRFDYQMVKSYLKLLDDIKNGLLKSELTRGQDIHFSLEPIDAFAELEGLLNSSTISQLKMAEPRCESYRAGKELLLAIQEKSGEFGTDLIWADSLRLGDRDSLVISLKKRLWVLGDFANIQKSRSLIFDKDLEVAIKRFQERHLLPVTGILDNQTTVLLNKPMEDVINELQLNLERWRWLPNHLGAYYTFVNIPAFEMDFVQNDSLLLRQNVVCGKVSRSTPSFNSTMAYLVINPTWTIPPTILKNDVLPAFKKNSNYLLNKNIKVYDVGLGRYIEVEEMNRENLNQYRYVQSPGLTNSLGVIKFVFSNEYYIFMHDTPHKELFNHSSRAYSSGCIRLAQPREFAALLLLCNSEVMNIAKIDSVVSLQQTTTVSLKQKPSVYIHYLTQDYKNGMWYTYPDVYGYNNRQLAALRSQKQ